MEFVARAGSSLVAVEGKSGHRRGRLPGMTALAQAFPPPRTLLVVADGIPAEEFLLPPVEHWVRA